MAAKVMDADTILPTAEPDIFQVKSETDDSLIYMVELAMGVCECVAGYNGKMCKHQTSVIVHYNLTNDHIYQNTANEKFFYSKLALGEESRPLTFFGSDTVTIESTTSFGNNSTMHPTTSNHEEEPSSLIPNETSCSEAQVILSQEKEPTALNERVGLTYRLLQESLGILTTKIDAIAGNITAITALQRFKSRLILCKSEGQLLSALNNFGSQSWRKNAGRKIQCQPSAISR